MLEVYAPYNRKLIDKVPMITKATAEKMLKTAYDLFKKREKWLPAYQRIAILEKLVELMNSEVENLTKIAAREGGKPYMDSQVEVLRAINGIKIAISCIQNQKGEEVPMGITESSVNRLGIITREPIGVVMSVSAFNHPLNLIIHQTVTAIAAGCPVIIKPASTTPFSCIHFVELLQKAGLPKAWCQVAICDKEIAEMLVTDPRVHYFSFIGSAKVGWMLKSKLAPGTRCAMEHGGVAPVIVEPDADFKELIPALLKGGFYHAGQVCVSVQRVFVHESIAQEVATMLAKGAKKLLVGDPLNKATEVGPLISPEEVKRVDTWIKEAIKGGAKVLCGAKPISETCYAPTVLMNPPMDARVSTEEIFGPLVCVYSYTNRNEAVALANGLDVHFQAAAFTKNIDVAMELARKLDATAVMVNDHTAFRVDWMPFGGRDTSGIGMGGIPYSIHEMTREKLIVIKSKGL